MDKHRAYLRCYLFTDEFVQLRGLGVRKVANKNIDWGKVTDLVDLVDNYTDYQVVKAIEETYQDKLGRPIKSAVSTRLDGLRKQRNLSAHASDPDPKRPEALAYISQCIDVIELLEAAKEEQFPGWQRTERNRLFQSGCASSL